jgi:hypothetical protein
MNKMIKTYINDNLRKKSYYLLLKDLFFKTMMDEAEDKKGWC